MEILVLDVLGGVLASAFGLDFFTDGSRTVTGSAGDDHVPGSEADEYIRTGQGDDLVIGGGGSDVVDLGPGDDRYFEFLNGSDRVAGGPGADDISAAGRLYADGGADDDALTALDPAQTELPDTLIGGAGDDLLTGDDGDLLTGGAGTDDFVSVIDETGDRPVTITDFDADHEKLVFKVDGRAFPAYDADDVTLSYAPDAEVLTVYVGGYAAAQLNGVQDLDPSRIEVRMV
jgi:Ca2+-binding RTX toxin-like protein